MLTSRRRAALALTAAVSVASLITLAVPAQAVVPPTPAWPSAGRVPSVCDAVSVSGGPTAWLYGFTDTTVPTITDVRFGSGTSPISVLAPAGSRLDMSAKVDGNCSGVSKAGIDVSRNGVIVGGSLLVNTTADAFSSWWSVPFGTVKPDDGVGIWKVPLGVTLRRYDSFVLDKDFKVSGTPVATLATQTILVGAWATKPFYVVRAMTLSNALSAAKAKKGKTVKATAVLKMATNTGYVVDAADKVIVQTKVGAGKWLSNATLTTNASGVVTYSFVLTATTQVRFIHTTVLSGKYTNGVTSAIKTVKRA